MGRVTLLVAGGMLLWLTLSTDAVAQKQPPPAPGRFPLTVQPKSDRLVKPARPNVSSPRVVMPNANQLVLLVRNTLITLNDAIQTGNFTVLRDRGAPGFHAANSAGRLSQIFSDLTSRGVDLSVVSIVTPQITEPPVLNRQRGTLNIKGYFPAPPVHIDFEVLYQLVEGRWRLFGLSVQVPKTNAEAGSMRGDGGRRP